MFYFHLYYALIKCTRINVFNIFIFWYYIAIEKYHIIAHVCYGIYFVLWCYAHAKIKNLSDLEKIPF